jgi:hypothetical protein
MKYFCAFFPFLNFVIIYQMPPGKTPTEDVKVGGWIFKFGFGGFFLYFCPLEFELT